MKKSALVLVGIVGIGIALYYALSHSGLRVYKNTAYRYEIRYPKDWTLEAPYRNAPNPKSSKTVSLFKASKENLKNASPANRSVTIVMISVYPNPQQLSLRLMYDALHGQEDQQLNESLRQALGGGLEKKFEATSFKGISGLRVIDEFDGSYTLLVPHEDNVFEFSLTKAGAGATNPNKEDIETVKQAELILESFNFTN